MQYYKDENNQVWAYEDGDANVKSGLTTITKAEADELLAPRRTLEDLVNMFNAAITVRLNAFAALKQYDSMQNAMLMKDSTAFKSDGEIAYDAYDSTWQAALALLPQILDGLKTKNLKCVRMDEIVYQENYYIDNNGIQRLN